MFEVHPYDGKLSGPLQVNQRNIARIEESFKGKDTLRYAFISDSQRWYDELEAFVKHANTRDDIDFVIHGGDVADFGLTKEFFGNVIFSKNLNIRMWWWLVTTITWQMVTRFIKKFLDR